MQRKCSVMTFVLIGEDLTSVKPWVVLGHVIDDEAEPQVAIFETSYNFSMPKIKTRQ